MPERITKYSARWEADLTPLQIEFGCIAKGGQWTDGKTGKLCGNGLFYHYKEAQKLLWPQEDHHRWSDLLLQEFINNSITCVLGGKDSGKTHGSAKFVLTDWFCFPEITMVIISSTDLRGLEMRVWGDLKSLWQSATELHDWLPGTVLESKHAITTDDLEDGEVRDMRKGIICVPTLSATGSYQGIGKFVGAKQKRRRMVGDEFQLMKDAMLESVANMIGSGDFKGIFLGNPLGQEEPLDKASEPVDGWASHQEPEKTTVWPNRWLNGRTVNLVGTDSPNFDFPENEPVRYPYLINRNSIAAVEAFYGKDSLQYYSQCKGVRKSGLNARRVITPEMCKLHRAFDGAQWMNLDRTRVAAADIAYGGIGGDRCVIRWGEFGPGVGGQTVLLLHPPVMVPVSVAKEERVEDQIACFCRDFCKENKIESSHFGYDSTGRGTMGTRFAKNWSADVVAIEFGGSPTKRPVSLDMYFMDPDTRERRLILCNEHYSKFVTELWFSVRYLIEGEQLRGLDNETAREGYSREWIMVRGNKIEIEPKDETKKRMGRSPDMFDCTATLVEIARQRGLEIRKLGKPAVTEDEESWYEIERRQMKAAIKRSTLIHN